MRVSVHNGLNLSRCPIALYLLLLPAVSMAYFDPGSGALMVQTLFTLIGAVLFYLRHPTRLFRAITGMLKRFWGNRAAMLAPTDTEDLHKLDGAVVGEEVK